MEEWEPALTATAIGSLPHTGAEEACAMTLRHLAEAPVWPQLPRSSFRENMYAQYSEGLPGVVIDEERRKVFCDTTRDLIPEVEKIYQACLDEDPSMARIGEGYASGLYRMAEKLAEEERVYPLLKGQVTGPVSFGLTVMDERKRPILYNDQLAEAMIRLLNLKARWMEGFLRGTGRAREVLIFLDEPYLVSVGSALVSVSRERVVESLRLCAGGLTCLTGVHCCGNTDWTLLFEAGVRVVSFDAYGYFDSLALYPEGLSRFLEEGGVLAWGLVPNSARVDEETADSLARRFEDGVAALAARGVDPDLLRERAMVTPSCGLEGVSEEQAGRAYRMASELAGLLRGEERAGG